MIRRDERNCTYGKPVNAFKTPQLKMVRIPMIRFILRVEKKVNLPFFFDKPTIQNGSYSSAKGSSLFLKLPFLFDKSHIHNQKKTNIP